MQKINEERTFAVSGMTCGHCKAAVESAIREVPQVKTAEVDLKAGTAVVTGNAESQSIVAAVEDAGYEARLVT